MKIEKLHRILLIRFLFVLTIIFFQFADGQTIESVLTSTNLHFALDNFQEKEIVRLSVPEGITTVEVEITLPLGIEYTEGTAVITKGEAKIIQKAGTLLSQPTFVVTINKGNTITFEFNRKVTSQALLLKGELKDTVRLKVGERLYDTKLSNSYYLRSPSLLLQPSPIVFDKKDGEHNDFFVLSNTGIGGVKDIYFSVDYSGEVSLIDLKYKGEKILPIGVVPAGYANAGAPLYRVEGTFFAEKKDRIVIYEHYTVANCQANCPIKYATYWGDNTLRFYETKEEIKLLHMKKEPTVITLSDDTYTLTTTESTTTTATTVGSVFANDRLNGKPIDIQKVIFSLQPQSTPNNFVITKDGNIIVPAHTPIGCYTLNYHICDNSQTLKNKTQKPVCQTATVTITILQSVTTPTTATSTTITATVVTPTVITLSDDTYTLTTTESTTTTATTVGSVFSNDSMNGKPIDIQKVVFSLLPQSAPTSFIITKDGNIIVLAQTPAGRYILNYRICDNSQTLKNKNQKPVCQTATVTIVVLQSVTTRTTTTSTTITATTTPTTVTPTVITLSDDTYTLTTTESTTTIATTVGSIFTNDRLNGKPIDIQKVIFSLLPQSTPNTFVITKEGNIIVPAQTPIGRYILNYRICDNSQTSKDKSLKPICKTATVTIVVLQSVTTPTTTTSTTITATTTPTVVTPTVITLSDDTYTITTTESTTTTDTTVGSVFTNDHMNGKPIDIQKVIFSLLPQSTPTSFIITKDGNIIVPSHTPIGRYTLNYRICDNSQTSRDKNYKPICQTATVTITILQSVTTPTTTASTTVTATATPTIVTPTVITLSDDTYTITTTESTTTTATTVGSVFTNDRLNGKPINIQKVIFSLLPQSIPDTFIITKDGNIIVPPQTPIGRYTLNYRICDNSQSLKNKSQKSVCQTATVTIAVLQSVTTPTTATNTTVTATTSTATVVTPTVIALSDDTYTVTTTESTTTTATTVGSVFTNDRLNGKPINIQKVIFSLLPQSIPNTFIITKDGNIIVPPHTPIGRYTLNYRICDNSQNSKEKNQKPVCQTATVTIVVLQSVTTPTTATSTTVTTTTTPTAVTPTVITLSDDTYTITTTESTTTTATTVGSVFTNDRLNGRPIDIQKVIFSLLPQSTPNTFVITKDGNIIVPAQTSIGRYTLNYRICDNSSTLKDKNFKPICQTATVTIAVLQSVTTPTTTTSTTITATITPTIVTPTIITLADDTYTLTTTESTTTTATTVGSVFANDRLNGKPIDIQKVIFSLLPQSTPNAFIITKNGNIIVPSHTPIGRYTLNYRICDNSQPSKGKSQKTICQTATVTIAVRQTVTTPTTTITSTITTTTPTVVTPTVITLSDDTYTLTTTESTTTTVTTVGSVFTNDRLNGKPIDIQKVIFSLLPQSTPNTFVITKEGNIIIPPQTPIGRYTLNYRICDNSQPSKDKSQKSVCQTATVTIVVLQSVTTPTTTTNTTITTTTTPTVITLSDDTYTVTTTESTTTTATTVGSVFSNDRMNGKSIDIQKVIFSLLPQTTPISFVITKEGNIIVPAQTPIGRYTLNYRICDNSQTSKNKNYKPVCQTATVTIVVLQSVTTTTTTSTTITTTTTPTIVTPTVITLSDDTYTLTTTESTTTTATTVGSVFANDRMNGKPIDIQKVIFSLLPQSIPNAFVITKDGNIIVPSQTPIGRYTLNYRICDNSQTSKDKNHKPVCQTATVTIAVLQSVTTPTTSTTVTTTTTATVVTPTVITLSDDTYTLTTTESTTTTATTVGSVFTNDRLNGKPIDIQKVIFSLLPQSIPTSFVITKDGNIIIPPHTPIGRYTLNYRICDNSQSIKDKNLKPICETATVTIAILQSVTTPTTATNTTVTATTPTVVTPTVITLSDDTYTITTTESVTTTATTVGSVFANDRLNGKPIDIQKVIFSLLPQSTPNTFVITKEGNVIIPAQTPIGHYTLNYRICDNSQPLKNKSQKPVCQTATVTIAVLQSVTTPTTTTPTTVTSTTTPTVITLSDDIYTVTTTESTTTIATTVGSVFTNDRLNGKPIDIQKVIFSLLPQSTPNTFIITKDGNIIIPPHTPIGRYTLNYRICDNFQTPKDKNFKPVCQTATITIAVLQSVTTSTTTTSTTVTTTTATVVTPTVITLSNDTYTVTTTESTTTTATTVGSVFANDSMNGKPINIQKVIFSLLPQSTPTSFVITKDGNIIVPVRTPIGRYTLNYRICDNSQPSKNKNHKPVCQTATVTIAVLQSVTTPTTTTSTTVTATATPTIVTPTVITLSDDTYTITTTKSTTTTVTTVGSVFTNDRMNGKPIDIQKVIFSLLTQSTPNTFIITKDGNIIIPAQTPIGCYTLNYRICDNSQPLKNKSQKSVCQTATVTIAVLQSVTTPTTITNTTVTVTTTPTVVTPTAITLSDDTYTLTTTESTTTTATTVGSVFSNDRLNGKPIDIQKVIFSLLPQSTPISFVITKDGNIIVPAKTPIGRYTLNYRICDSKGKSFKPICQTATITIAILQTPVTATVETDTSSTTQSATNQPIAVSDSATTPMNTPIRIAVLDNDTPYTATPKIVIFPTSGDAFVKEDNTILYRPRVRFIGTDYFVYELCTPSSQSCTTATVTVKVTHRVVADNSMSANGDDKNDYFHIVGIENYPDNQVIIYNRNGEKVFTISHYDNRQRVFKGIVEGEVSLPNAAHLPQDTYFYLIEYYDENRQLQRQIGWLYLKR